MKDFDQVILDPRVIFATLSKKKLKMKRVYGDYCIGLAKVNLIIEEFDDYFKVNLFGCPKSDILHDRDSSVYFCLL